MSIVGVWEVHAEGAPFEYHVMTFHADGTMLQSNPDHGNRTTSDSNGMGAWHADGPQVSGAFLEFTVDRKNPDAIHKGIVRFELTMRDNEFTGSATAMFYEPTGTPTRGPLTSHLTGTRFNPAIHPPTAPPP
ncbi:hypothetical protein [Nocardia alni]|uniref:hypothetical protein n=1 Tax=Nocardia alni TaxID=2815723 RepID=UPI0020B21747|nr:hypothetical protein [Nocardia alni]